MLYCGVLPVPGQEFVDTLCRMILDASKDISEPGERVDVVELGGLDQAVDGGSPATTFVGSGEGPVAPAGGHRPHRSLGGVVAHAEAAIVEEAHESAPEVEAVGDRLADLAAG